MFHPRVGSGAKPWRILCQKRAPHEGRDIPQPLAPHCVMRPIRPDCLQKKSIGQNKKMRQPKSQFCNHKGCQ